MIIYWYRCRFYRLRILLSYVMLHAACLWGALKGAKKKKKKKNYDVFTHYIACIGQRHIFPRREISTKKSVDTNSFPPERKKKKNEIKNRNPFEYYIHISSSLDPLDSRYLLKEIEDEEGKTTSSWRWPPLLRPLCLLATHSTRCKIIDPLIAIRYGSSTRGGVFFSP